MIKIARKPNHWKRKSKNGQRSFVGLIFMDVGHDNDSDPEDSVLGPSSDTGNRNNCIKKKTPTRKSIIIILVVTPSTGYKLLKIYTERQQVFGQERS